MKARIGIDFGGVITRTLKRVRGEDTGAFMTDDPASLAVDGAIDGVRHLVMRCEGRVWIVSKAGPYMQEQSKRWLEAVDFYERTSLHPDHVRFCLERSDKEPICKELGLTHFIDDRLHLMQILRHAVPHLCLFTDEDTRRHCPHWATPVVGWPAAIDWFEAALASGDPATPPV